MSHSLGAASNSRMAVCMVPNSDSGPLRHVPLLDATPLAQLYAGSEELGMDIVLGRQGRMTGILSTGSNFRCPSTIIFTLPFAHPREQLQRQPPCKFRLPFCSP